MWLVGVGTCSASSIEDPAKTCRNPPVYPVSPANHLDVFMTLCRDLIERRLGDVRGC